MEAKELAVKQYFQVAQVTLKLKNCPPRYLIVRRQSGLFGLAIFQLWTLALLDTPILSLFLSFCTGCLDHCPCQHSLASIFHSWPKFSRSILKSRASFQILQYRLHRAFVPVSWEWISLDTARIEVDQYHRLIV
jgi:hypothetical protein